MSYLFLDDIRQPKQVKWVKLPECVEWNIVRNYNEFQDFLSKHGIPKFVAFDCDLGEEHYLYANNPEFLKKQERREFRERTGIDCAKLLIQQCERTGQRPPEFVVHSMNIIGGREIKRLMEDAQKRFDNSTSVG